MSNQSLREAELSDYPPLPEPTVLKTIRNRFDDPMPIKGFTEEQMRAYVDADRAHRPSGAALSDELLGQEAQPVAWPTLAVAIGDPRFHVARGIMGTENMGQDEALRRAILSVLNPSPVAAPQSPASASGPVVKYVPVDSRLRDKNWRHPNDDEPRTAACREAFRQRGDDEGQGLDGYWKWGFAAGFNAALAAPQPPAPTFAQFCKKYGLDPEKMDSGGGMWARVAIEDWQRAIAQPPAEQVCKCSLRTRLVGDGCSVCNPELAKELTEHDAELSDAAARAGGDYWKDTPSNIRNEIIAAVIAADRAQRPNGAELKRLAQAAREAYFPASRHGHPSFDKLDPSSVEAWERVAAAVIAARGGAKC